MKELNEWYELDETYNGRKKTNELNENDEQIKRIKLIYDDMNNGMRRMDRKG